MMVDNIKERLEMLNMKALGLLSKLDELELDGLKKTGEKVKQAISQEALLTITDRDDNENSKRIKIKRIEGKTLPSDILRDSIEEMRSKLLAMIPDIKRQEEAGDNVWARATVLKSDLQDCREQLAEVKHEYTSRLNQISSILRWPH